MKELDELIRISKLLRNIAFSTFIVLWAEVIFMLTKYETPGQLLYKEYGENGMSIYFLVILTLMIFLLKQSQRIEVEVKKIKEKNKMN